MLEVEADKAVEALWTRRCPKTSALMKEKRFDTTISLRSSSNRHDGLFERSRTGDHF